MKKLKVDVIGNVINSKRKVLIIYEKIKSINSQLLDKISTFIYIENFLSKKGHIYINFAIPRFKKKNHNWGDDFNFIIGEKISGKKVIPYRYSWLKDTNYLIVGSVIQWYCNKKSIIWGAGLLYDVNMIREKPKQVLAVRGPLTRQGLINCGVECPEVYGDPALLLPLFYKPKISKPKYKLGIIFHFTEVLKELRLVLPDGFTEEDVIYIDIMNYGEWSDFVDKVVSCEIIFSSSLHGIVVAETYKVPNLWVIFSELSKKESIFKYKDFYLGINKNIVAPHDYNDLLLKKNLVDYVLNFWEPFDYNMIPLIEACPIKEIKDNLLINI